MCVIRGRGRGRKREREKEGEKDRQKVRERDRETKRETDRQTDRQRGGGGGERQTKSATRIERMYVYCVKERGMLLL